MVDRLKVWMTGAARANCDHQFNESVAVLKHYHRVPTKVIRESSQLVLARSQAINTALNEGADIIVNIDDDNADKFEVFVETFRVLAQLAVKYSIVGGVYARNTKVDLVHEQPSQTHLALQLERDGEKHTLGPKGGIKRIKACGLGLTAIHRRVFDGLRDKFPHADNLHGPMWFQHNVVDRIARTDDYSFFGVARDAGYFSHIDTRILPPHLKSKRIRVPEGEFIADRTGLLTPA